MSVHRNNNSFILQQVKLQHPRLTERKVDTVPRIRVSAEHVPPLDQNQGKVDTAKLSTVLRAMLSGGFPTESFLSPEM